VRLKLSHFKRQKVLFEDGVFATRVEVIKYVANKWGGVHFDNRLDDQVMTMIDHAGYYYGFKLQGDKLEWTVNFDGSYQIQRRSFPNDVIDIALLSVLNTAQSLCGGLGLLKQKAVALSEAIPTPGSSSKG
jgi:hypothetical protein